MAADRGYMQAQYSAGDFCVFLLLRKSELVKKALSADPSCQRATWTQPISNTARMNYDPIKIGRAHV